MIAWLALETRDELIVAMNLYSRLTFGQLHARNPDHRWEYSSASEVHPGPEL